MKHLLIILTFLCLNTSAFSQGYEIENLGSNYSQSEIELVFSSINWCEGSYKSKLREITLDDGAKITILPANGSCGQNDEFIFIEKSYSIKGNHLVVGQVASTPTKAQPYTINPKER